MIYLDWAATTPPDRDILNKALEESLESYANPSSPHVAGKAAKMSLERSRASFIASLATLAAPGTIDPRGKIAFTASGTEADQIPLLSLFKTLKKKRFQGSDEGGEVHLIVSAIEHSAIHAQAEALSQLGFSLTLVKPDSDGCIRPSKIAEAIRPTTKLVAVMTVNNETGAIQDIEAIGSAIASATSSLRLPKAPLFHVDCVQALGKVPFTLSGGQISSAAFSAHKIGGPKGVGALWHATPIDPLCVGGGQEEGIRSGTENIFGIAAFAGCAAAAAAAFEWRIAHARILEARLLTGLGSFSGAQVVPLSRKAGDLRWSPWIVSAAFPGLGGEVLARALSDEGIAVSTGSACSHTGKAKGRRILDAMGLPADIAFSAIRVSFGPTTSPEDIDIFLQTAGDLYRRLKT
ncbi:MAG: cysteine desulfurase [Spirochaetae bacterium HGW-Spirochaetae-9]|nr:MAG: cysteine desulfurase [Spirochaetae bacterium HGW-Spirochaetae-9]